MIADRSLLEICLLLLSLFPTLKVEFFIDQSLLIQQQNTRQNIVKQLSDSKHQKI